MRGQALVAALGERCEITWLHESTCGHCKGITLGWFEEKPKREEVYGE